MYRSLLLYFYRFTVSIKLVLELCLLCVCVDDLLFSFVFAICDDDALCCHSFSCECDLDQLENLESSASKDRVRGE